MKPPKPKRSEEGPTALALVEEAVQLLRCAPVYSHALYLATALPWILGLLFGWAYVTWFAPSSGQVAWGALLLSLLFLGFKAGQGLYCEHLLAFRRGLPAPQWSLARFVRSALFQARHQVWGLVAVPISTILTLPLAWCWSYYQTLSVVGRRTSAEREAGDLGAWELASLWPVQLHLLLTILIGTAFVGWICILVSFFVIPFLVNRLFGVGDLFGLHGWSVFNTTFLASSLCVSFLAVDPLVKAVFVVRVFHGRSRRTGEDIREAFLAAMPARALLSIALLLGFLALSPRALAVQTSQPADRTVSGVVSAPQVETSSVDAKRLEESLARQREKADFQWRLRPKGGLVKETEETPAFVRFLKDGFAMLVDLINSIKELIDRFVKWVDSLAGSGASDDSSAGVQRSAFITVLKVLIYVLLGVVVLLAGYLLFQLYRKARRIDRLVLAAGVSPGTPIPDLRDEAVHAAQLPSSGWLELARKHRAAREWRLTLRALYLASLARLGEESLVVLARHKTNLEYELELARRAPGRRDLVERFHSQRLVFDSVWYGRVEAEESLVLSWFVSMEPRQGEAAP